MLKTLLELLHSNAVIQNKVLFLALLAESKKARSCLFTGDKRD